MTRLMLVVEENFKYSRENSTLRRKLAQDPLDIVTAESFQNLFGVLINVVL